MVCLVLSAFTGTSQIYLTARTTLHLTDSQRGNRRITAEVYYPASEEGKDIPVAENSQTKFPVLCFGHGYLLPEKAYRNLWEGLVPAGYIVAFPEKEKGMFPSHRQLAEDLAFVLKYFRSAGEQEGSLFYGRISQTNCCMGHSMGGGSAVLAAALDPTIGALALLAPYDTRPSATDAAAGIEIPVLIIAGDHDCVTPPEKHQLPLFRNLKSPDKTIITIIGGSHCQMTSSSVLCRMTEKSCRPAPAISAEDQHALISKTLILWLNSRLKGIDNDRNSLTEWLGQEQTIRFESTVH